MSNSKTGIIEVADGIYAFIQPDGGTNGGFIVGEDGVIVIEGLMTQGLTSVMKRAVSKVTSSPIRVLIVTHFHGDHSFGIQHYLPVAVVGHSECRREIIERWSESIDRFTIMRPDLADEFRGNILAPPDMVFSDTMDLYLGSRRIELLHYGRGHTRGDILVHLPKEKLVFSGDVVVEGGLPFTMDGYMSEWMAVLEKMERLEADTIIPGHGFIGDMSMVIALRGVFDYLKIETQNRFDAGMSIEQAAENITLSEFGLTLSNEQLEMPIKRFYMEFCGEL